MRARAHGPALQAPHPLCMPPDPWEPAPLLHHAAHPKHLHLGHNRNATSSCHASTSRTPPPPSCGRALDSLPKEAPQPITVGHLQQPGTTTRLQSGSSPSGYPPARGHRGDGVAAEHPCRTGVGGAGQCALQWPPSHSQPGAHCSTRRWWAKLCRRESRLDAKPFPPTTQPNPISSEPACVCCDCCRPSAHTDAQRRIRMWGIWHGMAWHCTRHRAINLLHPALRHLSPSRPCPPHNPAGQQTPPTCLAALAPLAVCWPRLLRLRLHHHRVADRVVCAGLGLHRQRGGGAGRRGHEIK